MKLRNLSSSLALFALGVCGCQDDPSSSEDGGAGATGTDVGGAGGTANQGGTGATQAGGAGGGSAVGGGNVGGGATVPEGVLFFDGFDYPIAREAIDKFVPGGGFATHGWSGGKDAVNHGPGAGGWLYTASAVSGAAGPLPGVDSTHALVVEAKAATFANDVGGGWRQTDFYLQYGDVDAGPLSTIPPDVWFQQWIYIADSNDQPSLFPPTIRLGKWVYPTRNSYPSTDLEWLWNLSGVAVDAEVENQGSSNEIAIGQKSLAFQLNLTDTDDNIFNDGRPDARGTLGSCGTAPERLNPMSANQWWLVRMHIDHTVSPGVVETWVRSYGDAWTKIVDTPASETIVWTPRNQVDGHRGLRFPTTMNNWYQNPGMATTQGDWWIYVDDFAIAAGVNAGGNGEADLPRYAL